MVSGIQSRPFALKSTLVDRSLQGCQTREKIADVAGVTQALAGFGCSLSTAAAITGLCLFTRFFVIGTMVMSTGISTALACREVYTICKNTNDLMTSDERERSLRSANVKSFVNCIVKDTLFIGPVFGPALEVALQNAKVIDGAVAMFSKERISAFLGQ